MADEVLEMEFRMRDFITQNMKNVEKGLVDVGKKFDDTNEKSKKTKSSFEKLKNVTQGLAGGFFALYGIKKAADFMMSFAEAADRQLMAESMLTNALGKTSEALKRQAQELQNVTRYGDEETLAAQARVAAYIKDEGMIKKLIPTIQDFAAAKQVDLSSAADIVTKSIVGQTNMLERYGIKVQGQAKTVERFDSVVKNLGATFEGTAATVGAAGLGPWKQFQNQIGDVSEDIGKLLINPLTKLSGVLSDVTLGMRVVFGLGTGDAIKDLGLLNEKIFKLEEVIGKRQEGKGFLGGFAKAIGSNAAEAAMMQPELDKLLEQRGVLEKKVNEILSPQQSAPGDVIFAGDIQDGDKAVSSTGPDFTGIQLMSEMQMKYIEDTRKQSSEAMAQQRAEEQSNWKARLDASTEYYEATVAMSGSAYLQSMEYADSINQMITQNDYDAQQERLSNLMMYADVAGSVYQAVSDVRIGLIEREREADIKKATDSIRNEKQRAKAIDEINKKADAARLKQAKKDKAAAIVMSVINTALAISKAISNPPGMPYNLPFVIATGALGAAQVATIASQKLAVGGRTTGGLTMVGERGPEMVSLPKGSQVLSAIDTRNAINQVTNNNTTQNSGGNQYTIVVQDKMTGAGLRDMLRSGELDNFVMDFKQRGRM